MIINMREVPINIIKNTNNRCDRCGLFNRICICQHITKTKLNTRLTLLIHSMELRRITNTGRLANLCLDNSEMFIRGKQGIVWDEKEILPDGYEHRILFPNAVQELTPDMAFIDGKPLNLIVPDGTWNQAKKIIISEPYLQKVKRVKLAVNTPSLYYLRKTPKPGHISTLEAIARAFGILENDEIQEQLELVFSEMTTNLIKLRGYK